MKTELRTLCAAIVALLLLVISPGSLGAQPRDFRTDINPALLYFQAFQAMPQLSDADAKEVFDHPHSWRTEPFSANALKLLKGYDSTFKLLHRAQFSEVPCDWGYDLSDGPEALLPGLAPAKRISQAARLRFMAALDADRFDLGLQDLSAAYALGRNLSTDRILISALVQIAIENIITSIVMENYYRLTAEQLDEIVAAFDAAPRRGTIADTIYTEDRSFFGYTSRRVQRIASEAGGDIEQFWKQFEAFWNPIATEVDSTTGPEPSVAVIRQAAKNDPTAVIALLNEMPPLYTETARVMSLPYREFKAQAPALWKTISSSKNPFIKQFFTLFQNIRGKEFSAIVRREMVRAAAAYKRGGLSAMRTVEDPLVSGAFEFTKVEFEGVERGFRLKSPEMFRDFAEVMIFLEKSGPPFRLDGIHAGTAR